MTELTTRPQSDNPTQDSSASELRREFEFPDALLDEHFRKFNTFGDPVLIKAKNAAMRFCADMASGDKRPRWIVMLGNCGTGKTMLARCITRFFSQFLDGLPDERNAVNERYSRRGGFRSWGKVIDEMVNGDYSGMRNLREDWFVCLDDIGVEYGRHKELSISKLYDILNHRLELFTVITANKTLEDISEWDARISSRMIRNEASVISIVTTDFNMR